MISEDNLGLQNIECLLANISGQNTKQECRTSKFEVTWEPILRTAI